MFDTINKIGTNIKYADQDILNYYFFCDIDYFPKKYNFLIPNRLIDNFKGRDAFILHYYGKVKPWSFGYFSFIHSITFWTKGGRKAFGFVREIYVTIINLLLWPLYIIRRIFTHKGAE